MFKSGSQTKGKRRLVESESSSEELDTINTANAIIVEPKRRLQGIAAGLITAKGGDSTNISVESETSTKIVAGIDAFRMSGIDSGVFEDTVVRNERVREIQKQIDSGDLKEGVSRKSAAYGPKAVNMRVTSRFDYQMDICKDYKDSGYCGFGDTCKFLHDRSVVKTGWELDREWAERNVVSKKVEEEEEKKVCYKCAKYDELYKTQCNHIYCETCFLQTSSVKCQKCGSPTFGIFNALL